MRIVFLAILLVSLELRAAYLGDISTIHSVTNLTALEALVVSDKTPVLLKGYYVEGDSPAVTYVFAAGDTSTVDNGSVVTNAAGRFKLQPQGGRVDIRTFGAIGDWLEIGAVWTNTAGVTNISLASAPATNYVGKKIALRRGNTSVAAEVTLLATDLSGTVISSFTVVSNGQGYINIPTNVLVSGPGSGATTTCVLTNGRLSSITVTGGGTGYTTNSVFKIRSTDCGTTNAPYYTELFSVSNQVGTTIGLSGTPTFSDPLNYDPADPFAEVGAAALYTDNQVAIQAAVDYAATHGLEVYIPQGDFGTGPVYLNKGQRITGGGQELARLHSAAKIGFTTFRKSVLAPKNINTGTGTQLSNSLLADVQISDFSIDGSGLFQSPLGTDLNSGNFAVFGINCSAVDNWHISRMTITNCQGGAIYYGSFAPASGADWSVVQSLYITTKDCRFEGNWRQAHQMGNVRRLTEENCKILDSSRGYYESQISRNLAAGTSVGQNGTYSPEQIDAEANANATSGYYKFINCWMQNKYGKAIDFLYDQQHADFVDCTFNDNLLGAVTCSTITQTLTANNQDAGNEWVTFQNCRFLVSSTNYGAHLILKFRGARVMNCLFQGKTSSTVSGSTGDIVFDGSGFTGVPAYQLTGLMFVNNTVNLYANDSTDQYGVFSIQNGNNNVRNALIANNTWVAARINMSNGGIITATDSIIPNFEKMAVTRVSEGYAYQTSGGASTDYKSEGNTAGFGLQDFTIMLRFAVNSASSMNGELWRYHASREIGFYNTMTQSNGVYFLRMTWNPSFGGARDIYIPSSALRDGYWAYVVGERPVNLTVTRSHGSVYKINVTNPGSGYTPSTTLALTFASGAATGVAQTDSGGTVTNAYVLQPGSGYTTNPVVSLVIGGGVGATFTASAGRLSFYMDDNLIWTDTGTDVINTMLTTAANVLVSPATGTQNTAWYGYGIWNKALTESGIRNALLYGPSESDKWGVWNSTAGCLSYVKMNSGIGYFFEDPSANKMHLWCGQDVVHGIPKRNGQVLKTITVTAATGGTNSLNGAVAAGNVLPANARITSAYVVPKVGAAPTVRIGFDSAITDQLVAPVTLTANTTNYLSLVPSMVYGTTNRPVYLGQTGAATNEVVINYSLDQGGLDGSTIQSGIVTAPGGLGSTSAIAATAIDATGWTNTFGVNAMVYAEGTGLQFTVYNAAGTPVYTNAATVGSASIALQKGAKMIVIAGTGVSGRAVPW